MVTGQSVKDVDLSCRVLLDGLEHLRGGKRLDKALQHSLGVFNSARTEVPKVAVVFISGRNGRAAILRQAVRPLIRRGVTVYVVGIGRQVDTRVLGAVAQRLENVLLVNNFRDLLNQVGPVARHIGEFGLLFLFVKDLLDKLQAFYITLYLAVLCIERKYSCPIVILS